MTLNGMLYTTIKLCVEWENMELLRDTLDSKFLPFHENLYSSDNDADIFTNYLCKKRSKILLGDCGHVLI